MTSVLKGFDPTLLLVLNLAGTFVFGLSGGLAGVQARLDAFGVVVLAVTVGLAGGITRDVLIGIPPQTFRDWRYLAVAGGAGLVTFLAAPMLERLERPVLVFDAAGLALFCVTGASTALDHRVGAVSAVVLGAITGIGGGMLRDILLREIPTVLRTGLYAIPALIGATIVVVASESGTHNLVVPIVGAAVCFVIRLAGLHFDLNVPHAPGHRDAAD
ncbi:MAG TPA: trimeric intracellular cation channel family protein [Gaiella sp.]|nr:trimeric intracellular cation channel family protein [Gaiella sp.]